MLCHHIATASPPLNRQLICIERPIRTWYNFVTRIAQYKGGLIWRCTGARWETPNRLNHPRVLLRAIQGKNTSFSTSLPNPPLANMPICTKMKVKRWWGGGDETAHEAGATFGWNTGDDNDDDDDCNGTDREGECVGLRWAAITKCNQYYSKRLPYWECGYSTSYTLSRSVKPHQPDLKKGP